MSLYAEIIVRNIASEFLNIGNSDIEILRGKYGKPYLKGYANFHFNVSHTHNAIAVAVADTPIGIDIERIRPLNDSIVKRLYLDNSISLFQRMPQIGWNLGCGQMRDFGCDIEYSRGYGACTQDRDCRPSHS